MPFAPSKHARGLGGAAETGATAAVGTSKKLLQECWTSRDFCSFVLNHIESRRHLVRLNKLTGVPLSKEFAYFRTDGERAIIKNQHCRQHASRRPSRSTRRIHSHVPVVTLQSLRLTLLITESLPFSNRPPATGDGPPKKPHSLYQYISSHHLDDSIVIIIYRPKMGPHSQCLILPI